MSGRPRGEDWDGEQEFEVRACLLPGCCRRVTLARRSALPRFPSERDNTIPPGSPPDHAINNECLRDLVIVIPGFPPQYSSACFSWRLPPSLSLHFQHSLVSPPLLSSFSSSPPHHHHSTTTFTSISLSLSLSDLLLFPWVEEDAEGMRFQGALTLLRSRLLALSDVEIQPNSQVLIRGEAMTN